MKAAKQLRLFMRLLSNEPEKGNKNKTFHSNYKKKRMN